MFCQNWDTSYIFHFQYQPQFSPSFSICQIQIWGYFYTEKFPWWLLLSIFSTSAVSAFYLTTMIVRDPLFNERYHCFLFDNYDCEISAWPLKKSMKEEP